MANSAKEIRVSAKTLEAAVSEAASMLNISQESVGYRVVSQTNGGFFSFLGKKVEISAWPKVDKRSEAVEKDRRKSARKPTATEEVVQELGDEEVEALTEDLRSFCSGICERISGESVKVTAEVSSGRLVLDIDDEYLANQIGKNSKLAESLEHILRKKPRHLKRELPFRIFVDVRGIRRKREDDLIELAKDLSEKVSDNKRPIVLNYKSSYDRKIIHMALDKDERVYTKSIGTGPNRKLMILPIKKKDGEPDQKPEYID